jgi:glucan 1,3-beta-glucosidase
MTFSAEHHVLYQYNLVGAKDHYMGLIQTETVSGSTSAHDLDELISFNQPYFQPVPLPPAPFSSTSAYHDPVFKGITAAWGLRVQNSYDIIVFGVLMNQAQDY